MQDQSNSRHPDVLKKLSRALDQEGPETDDFLHLDYQIGFHPKKSGMLLWVYQGTQNLTQFERFGIHALGLHQKEAPNSHLHPSHRRFLQNLLRFASVNSSEGYYHIPQKHVAFFMPKLARFHQVKFFNDKKLVQFSEHLLTVLVELEGRKSNFISLSASFRDEELAKDFSFTQAKLYAGRRSWVMIDDVVYALKSSPLTSLLEDFNELGHLILQGEQAADFVQDYLPLLSQKPEVVLPDNFALPEVLQVPAKTVYEISEDEENEKLVLEIQFSYDEYLLPAHANDSDVMAEVEKTGKTLLIRRDLDLEKKVLKEFHEQGFKRVGPTRFETGGSDAFDFVSEFLPEMQKNETFSGEEHLKNFRLIGELGAQQLKARATNSSIDWLEMQLGFEIDGIEVPYEVVQSLAAQGQRYLKLPDKGIVKLNLEEIQEFEDKLGDVEGLLDDNGGLKLSRYHAAYLNDLVSMDWGQEREIQSMLEALRHTQEIPLSDLPPNLNAQLREYQHHGFSWMSFLHEYKFHGILADDMGLGKTIQTLTYLQDRKNRFGHMPNLVMAPTSVVFNWMNEAQKFVPEMKVLVLNGPGRKEFFNKLNEYDLVITSYALFRRDVEVLTALDWGAVILDEAQNIKNYRSKTALLVKELKAKQRWALSGTPLENRLSELWSIFDFLMPGFLGSYPHFQRKYQQPIEMQQSKEHLERLRKRIYPFVMRRLKDEVASELPPKTEITNYCEMTPAQEKLYQEVMAACRRQVFSEVEKRGVERSQVSILTALLRLRQVCCHPELLGPSFQKRDHSSGKMEAFKELVTEVIDEGHRILVFSQFVEMLTLLRNWLEKEKIPYEYLDGRTRRREEKVKRFNENDDIPIFLVSLRAGGTGLNLTGASYVIHYDPWWNPAVQDQATDRVHRIGQKKHVFAYRLITKGTVEEKILHLQERKKSLAKELLSVDSSLGKSLSQADVEYLFS